MEEVIRETAINGCDLASKIDSSTNLTSDLYDSIAVTAEYISSRTKHRPTVAIICGSGLGGLAELVQDTDVFDYKNLPNFTASTVKGHAGKLILGTLCGKSVICMQGRNHAYEGHSMWKVTFPVRVFARLGVTVLLVTNASGSLNPDYSVGDVMILKDHISLAGMCGLNPLIGLNDDRFGPRFPAMTDAYDATMRQLVRHCAGELKMDFVRDGVYVYSTGPCFETVAEARMMRILGGDTAGMSTVPEVVVARHCGIRCLGISIVTNVCTTEYSCSDAVDHADVLQAANHRANDIRRLVALVVQQLSV